MTDDRRSALERLKPQARTEAEWRRMLTPLQYRVLRARGSEPPGSSPLMGETRPGLYSCAGCGHPVFEAKAKFDSGSGFPSFRDSLPGAVRLSEDRAKLVVLSAVGCGRCGSHLGRFYKDEPKGAGPSYRINGVALVFRPR